MYHLESGIFLHVAVGVFHELLRYWELEVVEAPAVNFHINNSCKVENKEPLCCIDYFNECLKLTICFGN